MGTGKRFFRGLLICAGAGLLAPGDSARSYSGSGSAGTLQAEVVTRPNPQVGAAGAGLPRIGLSDTLLVFEGYRFGNSPKARSFTITNTTGVGVLNWRAVPSRFFLGVGPDAGLANRSDVFVWILATTDLRVGLHTGSIEISSTNAINSPETVFVHVRILCPIAVTGDVNLDSMVTQGAIIYLVNHVLKAGPAPRPAPQAGDVNCDRVLGLADVIFLVNYVLKGGVPPCDACTLL